MKKVKYMSPFRATTLDQVCSLNRDNLSSKHGWILIDGDNVTLAAQIPGQPATQIVSLPRAEFAKLARWYFTEQKLTV